MSAFEFVIVESFERILEGESSGDNSQGSENGGSGTNAGTGNTEGGAAKTGRTFTEAEVDAMITGEKKTAQEAIRRATAELENMKRLKDTTAEQRTQLEKQIEDLNNALLTKEELAKRELEKKEVESKTKIEALEAERRSWEDRFKKNTMLRELTDAANKYGALQSEQIIALLKDTARVIEVSDSEGNLTGVFETRIKMPHKDKEGKVGVLDLNAQDAVKMMRDNVDNYGNLFKDTNTGGAGMSGGSQSKGPADLKTMGYESYKKLRGNFVK